MEIDFEKTFKKYVTSTNNLLDFCEILAKDIKNFQVYPFDFNRIKVKDLEQFQVSNVLYFFEIANFGAKLDNASFCEKIQKIKDDPKYNFKLPLVNYNNAIRDNKILYVGKSNGSFKTRLKQHLGLSSPKTYALHLKQWRNHNTLSGIKLNLYYAIVDLNNEDYQAYEKDILEHLESALHLKFQPLLGRTGH